jgi:sRNA-binding carbon storage regulator CsrA
MMSTILKSTKSEGYGMVMRRRRGECMVIDGPSRCHFLQGVYDCLIVHHGDVDQVLVTGESIDLPAAALIYWFTGSGRIGIRAPRSIRVLRGELLGGLFAEDPLAAALAATNVKDDGDGPIKALTQRVSITQVTRSEWGIQWRR